MPIELVGMEELLANLDRLESEATKISIQRAGIRAASKVIIAAQKSAVPEETGRLKETIGMQIKKEGGNLTALIGPDKKWNYIGRFAEFGSQQLVGQKNKGSYANDAKRGRGTKFTYNRIQPAQHWLQKSWDASAHEALDAYTETVRKLFDKHSYDDLMAALVEAEGIDLERE